MRCGPQPWGGASIQVCPPLDTLPQPSDILQSSLPSHSHSVCHHLTLPCVNHSVLSISWLDPTDTTALKFYFYITIVILMPFVCLLVSELHEGRAHLLFQEHDKVGCRSQMAKEILQEHDYWQNASLCSSQLRIPTCSFAPEGTHLALLLSYSSLKAVASFSTMFRANA